MGVLEIALLGVAYGVAVGVFFIQRALTRRP